MITFCCLSGGDALSVESIVKINSTGKGEKRKEEKKWRESVEDTVISGGCVIPSVAD